MTRAYTKASQHDEDRENYADPTEKKWTKKKFPDTTAPMSLGDQVSNNTNPVHNYSPSTMIDVSSSTSKFVINPFSQFDAGEDFAPTGWTDSSSHPALTNNDIHSFEIDKGEVEGSRKIWWNALLVAFVMALSVTVVVLSIENQQYQQQSTQHLSSSSSSSSTAASRSAAYADWSAFYTQSSRGIVATDVGHCSDIGRDILVRGGNAIDAAVAATLCVGVLSPASSGIGGGCYILIHKQHHSTNQSGQHVRRNRHTQFHTSKTRNMNYFIANNGSIVSNNDGSAAVDNPEDMEWLGQDVFIDSREVAPGEAHPSMFQNFPLRAQNGGMAVATLGEVKGLYHAHSLYGSGKLSWRELVLPAVELAKDWVISRQLESYILDNAQYLFSEDYPGLSKLFLKQHKKSGKWVLKQAGDHVQQPKLAETLMAIAEQGSDYLYSTMASTLAREIQNAGGIVTTKDITDFRPTISKPLSADISGYRYLGVGGSSSGGIVVIGLLSYMFSYAQPMFSIGSLYYHRLVEGMKHVFAMRLSLGDPDFVDVADVYNALLNSVYMNLLRANTSDDHVMPSLSDYGGRFNLNAAPTNDAGTTHISVLDEEGNAVSITSTINTFFGSKVVSPSTGILFNNQMDDFSIPGASNYFGLAPSPLNYPQPYKKPLSSMSPSIVLDNRGRVRLIGGASGGPKIITATAQVILNYLGRGMDILSAVVAPRLHSQLLPDHVQVEDRITLSKKKLALGDDVIAMLKSKGHHDVVKYNDILGVSQWIVVDPDTGLMEGVSDPRKDGRPAGV
jgi:gamma-glutamyltranspeptidase